MSTDTFTELDEALMLGDTLHLSHNDEDGAPIHFACGRPLRPRVTAGIKCADCIEALDSGTCPYCHKRWTESAK